MGKRRTTKTAVLVATSAAAVLAPAVGAGAGDGASPSATAPEARPLQNCGSWAQTPEEMAAGDKPPPIQCFGTYAELLRAYGWTDVPDSATAATYDFDSISNQAADALAVHYNGYRTTDPSYTQFGSNCNGGGRSLVGNIWNDLVYSTRHKACGTVKHWVSGANGACGGNSYTTTGTLNQFKWIEAPVAGDVSCITYH